MIFDLKNGNITLIVQTEEWVWLLLYNLLGVLAVSWKKSAISILLSVFPWVTVEPQMSKVLIFGRRSWRIKSRKQGQVPNRILFRLKTATSKHLVSMNFSERLLFHQRPTHFSPKKAILSLLEAEVHYISSIFLQVQTHCDVWSHYM